MIGKLIGLPLPWKIAIGTGFVSLVLAAFVGTYFYGMSAGRSIGEATIAKFQLERQAQLTELTDRLREAEDNVVIEYVDRIQTITDTRTVYVDRATNDVVSQGELPRGWLEVHNAAVTGGEIDSDTARNDSPSGVRDTDALGVIAENYATCRAIRQQLISLQQWVSETYEVTNETAE